MRLVKILMLVVLIFSELACSKKEPLSFEEKPAPTPSGNEQLKQQPLASVTEVKIERRVGAASTAQEKEGGASQLHLHVYFPQAELSGEAVAERFNRLVKARTINFLQKYMLEETGEGNIDVFLSQLLEQQQSAMEEAPEKVEVSKTSWEIKLAVKIIFHTEKVVTLEFVEYAFLGGAHGNESTQFETYQLPDLSRLELSDLSENKQALLNIAEQVFREQNKMALSQPLESTGFSFPDGRFFLTKNFGLLEEGAVFYYNAYEIAPYAQGPTRLVVSYKRLESILSEKAKAILYPLDRKDGQATWIETTPLPGYVEPELAQQKGIAERVS